MTADDELARLKVRLAKKLRGFESGLPEGCDPWTLIGGTADPKLFPVPELVLFALRNVMGFRWSGVGEKVRWSVYATVEGEPFVFELRKFGFAIGHRQEAPPALFKRVMGQLSSALSLLEPLLLGFAKEQIAVGNLTMANRMSEFDNRYGYFRGLADLAFAPRPQDTGPIVLPTTEEDEAKSKKSKEKKKSKGNKAKGKKKAQAAFESFSAGLMHSMNGAIQRQQEGYFASGAMVDAFFSRLEHRVLLLRAFRGRPLDPGGFTAFLGMTWDERLKEVVDLAGGQGRDALLGRLRDVKATIRNPLSHGGVENDNGAFYFHMPRIGAVPANLSRYRGRLKMSFFPIADGTHTEMCALFDDVDAMLSTAELEQPNEFVRAGIDPQYDWESLKLYAGALADGPEAVEALIDHLGREWERHANMDY